MAKKARNVKKSEGKTSSRKFGTLRGKIFISEDFNAPLPDEILDAFEGPLDSEDVELKEARVAEKERPA